jgi:hypothetical protein
MPTKTPSKGKKSATGKESAPKKSAKAKPAKPPVVEEEEPVAVEEEAEGDDDEEEEGEAPARPAVAAPAAPVVKKPAASSSRSRYAAAEDAPPVVPARRLTPEAKARVNEMVKKGMSLSDALKAAASWETFVAPVKDEPAKLVQGKMGGGDGPRPSNFAGESEPEGGDDDDEEEESSPERED